MNNESPIVQRQSIRAVRDRLSQARSVVVLTGAGISVESGLSTFRDPGGLWTAYRPEDLANEAAFRRDPMLVQNWYTVRREQAAAAQPNAAHRALALLETILDDFLLVTQNVDGLHARAGSRKLVELHGTLAKEFCIECGFEPRDPVENTSELRLCADCSGLLRPGVVWFGESLPSGAFESAIGAANQCDVFLSVGTSSVVYPAAQLPLQAKEHGAFLVEVNVKPSAIASVMDVVLEGPAGQILPDLIPVETEGPSFVHSADFQKIN